MGNHRDGRNRVRGGHWTNDFVSQGLHGVRDPSNWRTHGVLANRGAELRPVILRGALAVLRQVLFPSLS